MEIFLFDQAPWARDYLKARAVRCFDWGFRSGFAGISPSLKTSSSIEASRTAERASRSTAHTCVVAK